jgi:hypothetical protein
MSGPGRGRRHLGQGPLAALVLVSSVLACDDGGGGPDGAWGLVEAVERSGSIVNPISS